MARPKQTQPTSRELEIFQVLWRDGSCTTRDIVEALNHDRRRKIAYTSVSTILGIMQKKGFVTRDDSARTHIYQTSYTRDEVEDWLVKHLVNDVFGGSAMRLVTRALSTQAASAEEVEQVKKLLEAMKSANDSTE